MNDWNDIKVSILMPSYNHKKYCIQAVESVLKQQVNFDYEIIIADDASSDGTAQILKENYSGYENIHLYLRKHNVGGTRNGYFLYKRAKGKYIIILECDDYWENENMLQSQVDFLESNEHYIGVGGKLNVVNEGGRHLHPIMPDTYYNREFTLDDFLKGDTLHFRAVLWRRNIVDGIGEELKLLYKADPMLGDFTLNILFLERGKVYLRDIIIANYRYVMKKGRTNYNSLRSNFEKYADHMKILKVLENKHIPQHDYSMLYDIRTVIYLREIKNNKRYTKIFGVIKVLGWKKFIHALIRYKKYKDCIIT